jgi:hypothetical protein
MSPPESLRGSVSHLSGSEVAVLHEKLEDGVAVAELKAFWRERLATLKQFLEA